MDELRLILLGVGAVIIALIYLWGMRSRIRARLEERRRRAAARLPENEPVLDVSQNPGESIGEERQAEDSGPLSAGDRFAADRLVDVEIRPIERSVAQPGDQHPNKQASRQAADEPQMTILLTILAPQGRPYQGPDILATAQELQLKFNESGVLDYLGEGKAGGAPVFSIAHLREPGTFDPSTIETLSTPGLLMFMHFPGPLEEVASVELMVSMARQLAQKLGGIVCDEHRNKMTAQAIVHLKSEAAEFERRRRVRAHPSRH
jgi:cell division protein ZipA